MEVRFGQLKNIFFQPAEKDAVKKKVISFKIKGCMMVKSAK